MRTDPLGDVVRREKRGQQNGITSICSAHPDVIRAVLRSAIRTEGFALIESTCNQVNQHGGYAGMTPEAFRNYIAELATHMGMPMDRVILGGDHLGPFVWRTLPVEQAMSEAAELVRAYVLAGYQKIHLDASMHLLGDNPECRLPAEVAASRAARLACVAEHAHTEMAGSVPPRYVIGTEVPTPGGATTHEGSIRVTPTAEVEATLDLTRECFRNEGIEAAWERVVAVVVQPGVEFGDDFVHDYDRSQAQDLVRLIERQPGLVYEAHSTDYQPRALLRDLVTDHFAILKVGPAVTYAFREMVFALAAMEDELLRGPRSPERSRVVEVVDEVMLRRPEHWEGHYRGSAESQAFARKFSLSDRVRYYWSDESVQAALSRLVRNLTRTPPPISLLSQFAPAQCARVRAGMLENTPAALIGDRIELVLQDYEYACQPSRFQQPPQAVRDNLPPASA